MHTTKLRPVFLFSIVLGLGGAAMMAACAVAFTPDQSACSTQAADPPVEDPPTTCAEPVKPCPMYRIELLGNPSMDPALRASYKKVLGSACFVAASNNTFNCYYKDPLKACEAVLLVPVAFGAALYEKHLDTCKEVNATLWSLQTGPNPANLSYIYFENAPVETSNIDVDGGAPIPINGPYRNLPQLTTVKAGGHFNCSTGLPGPDGGILSQRDWLIQVNRDANGGKIRSDMAGFVHPCKTDCPEICTEPEFLKEGPQYDALAAQVNHVARKTDLRSCSWGSNANSNAAVISGRLNRYLRNKYPTKEEVEHVNKVPPYTYTP